jgi:hypothetical protein
MGVSISFRKTVKAKQVSVIEYLALSINISTSAPLNLPKNKDVINFATIAAVTRTMLPDNTKEILEETKNNIVG